MPQLAPTPDTADQHHACMPAAGLVRMQRGRSSHENEWLMIPDTFYITKIILNK